MNDINGQDAEFTEDEEIQITDLDLPEAPLSKRATLISKVISKSLTTPWIRYGLSSLVILLLLGALILQWPRPASAIPNVAHRSSSYFLSAASAQGLLFIQTNDHLLLAYQASSGRIRWQTSLPSVATMEAENHTLYCYFTTPTLKTELEALDANTGHVLWRDALPAAKMSFVVGRFGGFSAANIQGPAFHYTNNALYIQSNSDTLYSIQTSNGQINWTFQTRLQPSHATLWSNMALRVQDDIVAFMSADSAVHMVDANTGREIIAIPGFNFSSPPRIDGQMIYILPLPNGSAIQVLHASDGQRLWTYPLPKGTWAQDEFAGVVYLGAAQGATLIALRGSDGHKLWTYQASDGQPMSNTFSVVNGVGYLIQQDATMVALRVSDGLVLWRTSVTALKSRINPTTTFFIDNGTILLYDSQPHPTTLMYTLRASDGHLLWHTTAQGSNPFLYSGALYTVQDNGQVDAWRESGGQHLWNYDAPIGSSIIGSLQPTSTLLFLQDAIGNLYAIRISDGKLLWRYP